jgi:hypothetical protein
MKRLAEKKLLRRDAKYWRQFTRRKRDCGKAREYLWRVKLDRAFDRLRNRGTST